MRSFTVYLLTNSTHSTIYTGITNDLGRRLAEHRSGGCGFTARYRLYKLVYFEEHPTALDAITREKQIKAGSRRKKIELIESMNPEWKDLAPHIGYPPGARPQGASLPVIARSESASDEAISS